MNRKSSWRGLIRVQLQRKMQVLLQLHLRQKKRRLKMLLKVIRNQRKYICVKIKGMGIIFKQKKILQIYLQWLSLYRDQNRYLKLQKVIWNLCWDLIHFDRVERPHWSRVWLRITQSTLFKMWKDLLQLEQIRTEELLSLNVQTILVAWLIWLRLQTSLSYWLMHRLGLKWKPSSSSVFSE